VSLQHSSSSLVCFHPIWPATLKINILPSLNVKNRLQFTIHLCRLL
jgi:hypothetical protein